ncbi:hypothetical protein BX666DRAFT_1995376 [Dichotomocladium elegans]|nr:hypothetical protein BX666DRAFT_1995376 [Dichotomocladium elegans]
MVLCCFWAGELGASVMLQVKVNQVKYIKRSGIWFRIQENGASYHTGSYAK